MSSDNHRLRKIILAELMELSNRSLYSLYYRRYLWAFGSADNWPEPCALCKHVDLYLTRKQRWTYTSTSIFLGFKCLCYSFYNFGSAFCEFWSAIIFGRTTLPSLHFGESWFFAMRGVESLIFQWLSNFWNQLFNSFTLIKLFVYFKVFCPLPWCIS